MCVTTLRAALDVACKERRYEEEQLRKQEDSTPQLFGCFL